MRFEKSPQLPGAGRARVWHHHRSQSPTSRGAILLGKMAYPPKQIRRECSAQHVTLYSLLYVFQCSHRTYIVKLN